jgi:hypothetical protein
MDTCIHIDNNIINSLPYELIELILDKLPFDVLLKCQYSPIVEKFIKTKYFSFNNIFKNMEFLMKNNYYSKISSYTFKYAAMIVDTFMSIINDNGGLVKNKYYNGEPTNLFLLRIKNKETTFSELISKFVDNDKESDGKCFGYSGWMRTVYLRNNLINKFEYMFRMSAYVLPYESIEIIKIYYPNGYDKKINGIDYKSPHEETIMIKFL